MRRAGLVLCVVPALLIGFMAVPAVAATPTTLYVSRLNPSACSDDGPGTLAVPFCDIQAAANVVQPGQTVLVGYDVTGSSYDGDIHITRSGTPDQPITFEARAPWTNLGPGVVIQPLFNQPQRNGFLLDGVHDVTITGFGTEDMSSTGVTVSNSSDITINHMAAGRGVLNDSVDGVDVTGTSHDVTISRDSLVGATAGIAIDPGVARVDVGRNVFNFGPGQDVVDNGTGTTITNNTLIRNGCLPTSMIGVGDGATATTVENNVVEDNCTSQTPVVSVSAAAASTTTLDYDIIGGANPSHPLPYSWAGTAYTTAAALTAATGQGSHDANPTFLVGKGFIPGTVAAIDSADASAPGFLAADFNEFTPEDDPKVADTGTGAGDVDRGAVEVTDPMTVGGGVSATQAPIGGLVTATLSSTPGWTPITGYTVDFGDGTPPVTTTASTVEHAYTGTGGHAVTVTATDTFGYVSAPVEIAGVEVVPPVPLASRMTVRRGTGFDVTVDTSASTNAWNLLSSTCDFGDGTPTVAGFQTCQHTYAHGGLYRITFTQTDASGGTASTNQLIFVPTNGFTPVPTIRVLHGSPGCGTCRGSQQGAMAVPNQAIPSAPVVVPGRAGASSVPDIVVAPRHGCVARAMCPAVAV